MEKKFDNYLGIDVSKETFDAALILQGNKEKIYCAKFSNDATGLRDFFKWLKKWNTDPLKTLFCMEHIGIYARLIIKEILLHGGHLWIEMSLKIIRSMGIQRGKNDKIDAQRIALYACKNSEEAVIYTAPRDCVEKIRLLLGQRDKLVQAKVMLVQQGEEIEPFDKAMAKLYRSNFKLTISAIEKDLLKIEAAMKEVIQSDERLKELFRLATSVPGIGTITALFMICFTNEFTLYQNSRQLACYCGIAPFEHTSGKSIRLKPKVHHMANKIMKKQLHLCALSASSADPEMREYFQRKVLEGKNKMLVINNIRNKLIHRVCAVINRNSPYEKKLQIALA